MYIGHKDVERPIEEQAPPAPASAGANVIVLSADPAFIDLLRDSLAGNHRVWRADDAPHAADLIVAAGNAVLLADSSLADHDTRDLVTRIHQQFPDLAIIVAGRRDDETRLAELVSQGVIFRFLHKPASPDRIRTFVDATVRRTQAGTDLPAAARRTGETTVKLKALRMPSIKLDPALIRRWSRRSLLLIPLALIILQIFAWKPWEKIRDMMPAIDQQRAAADASRESAIRQKLLESADLALSRGALVEPPEQNALELYRAVLARDPGNRTAERGIDRVADELLAQAESALMAQDLVALASAVDAARAARPDHPRLKFFTFQLERELERSSTHAQLSRPAVAIPDTTVAPVSVPGNASRVQGLVLLASERMRSNQLVGGTDSAQAYLLSARQIDQKDPGVQQGIAALAGLLEANARKAIIEGRLDEAGNWVRQAIELDVDRAAVAELRSELEVARFGNVREDRARLFTLANQRIAQGRLVEPVADSARHYLDLLRASDPAYEGLSETTALLADKALAEARRLNAAGKSGSAEALLKAAIEAGAPAPEVAAVATEIARARAPVVVPENELNRIHFVAPEYPSRALEQGTAGWVDIEFTVARDGSTRDATIRGSDPMGVFDLAALDAVAHWRYEPRAVNGVAIDQRVATHVRFELKN